MQFLKVALLGTSQKGVIAKMTYLAEFWLILERDLVECALHKIFDELLKKCYKEYYQIYLGQHILYNLNWICYEEVMTLLPETPDFD